jgi:hypothetical protein
MLLHCAHILKRYLAAPLANFLVEQKIMAPLPFICDSRTSGSLAKVLSAIQRPSNKSSKSREYAQEGPSSLQTRLNSFAVPRSRRAIALPPREDSSVYESVHTVEDINLPSPTRSRPILHQSLCLFVWNL